MLFLKWRTVARVILILVGFIAIGLWLLRLTYPMPYRDTIFDQARINQLDPYLVLAVIRVESKFNPAAESKKGALGLMQVMPETAEWIARQTGIPFTPEMLLDPHYNISIGIWYLNDLRREFGNNWTLVVAAYNGGRGNVRQWLDDGRWDGRLETATAIPYRETRSFTLKVARTYRVYRMLYAYTLQPGVL